MRAERTESAWQSTSPFSLPAGLLTIVWGAVESGVRATPVALLFALAARLPYFARSNFPLNDGGLFVAMSQDLLANHFALPAVTSYNAADRIPFGYPPLAFYTVAGLHALLGTDLLTLARWVPLVANLASVAGVAALSRMVLRSAWAVALAPIVFALLPRSYEWMIMGGGLTRSPGYLLAIVCVVQAVRLGRAPTVRRAAVCALLASLALATHLEEGLFALYSVALALACYARKVRAIVAFAGICLGAAVLTAPWWVAVIARHGLGPFLAASMTSGWDTPGTLVAAIGQFVAPPSVPLSLVGSLALVGAAGCLLRGDFFLPTWLVAIFILTPRSAPSEGVLPLALLASSALVELILPGLQATMRDTRGAVFVGRLLASNSDRWARTPGIRLAIAGVGLLLVLSGVSRVWPHLPLDPHSLDSLPQGEREAMAWIDANMPADESFLVLSSTTSWEQDMAGEWFPVLAHRQSVLTPQGAEWLPQELHTRKVCLFQQVREVSTWEDGLSILDVWASERGVVFSSIYISKAARGPVGWSQLLDSAMSSHDYTLVLDTPEAAVLQRSAPISPRWSGSGSDVVAHDCRSLADEGLAVMASFEGRYGTQAALAWVHEHEQAIPPRPSLTRLIGDVTASVLKPWAQ